jgi:hypothetical protein
MVGSTKSAAAATLCAVRRQWEHMGVREESFLRGCAGRRLPVPVLPCIGRRATVAARLRNTIGVSPTARPPVAFAVATTARPELTIAGVAEHSSDAGIDRRLVVIGAIACGRATRRSKRSLTSGCLVPASATAARVPRACVLRAAASGRDGQRRTQPRADVMSTAQHRGGAVVAAQRKARARGQDTRRVKPAGVPDGCGRRDRLQ